MRREGRQHGMVRSFMVVPTPLNPNSQPRFIHKFDTPTTAGVFTKVSRKPTNHSKFTGKCVQPKWSDCHTNPAWRPKDKTKGAQKIYSSRNVTSDVMKNCSGFSAAGVLDLLGNQHDDDHEYDDDELDHDGDACAHDDNKSEEEAADDDKDVIFCDVGNFMEISMNDEDWCFVEHQPTM